jgi:hypothetical protein
MVACDHEPPAIHVVRIASWHAADTKEPDITPLRLIG